MEVYFAVDVLGGSAVRLLHGDYAKKTVYYPDAAAAAAALAAAGARRLHVVDLDGARGDGADNFAAVRRIAASGVPFVQVGGGVRSMARIEAYLDAGASRVILGTAALRDPALLDAALARYGARIAVGVDARGGKVATRGWREVSDLDGVAFCRRLADAGVKTVIYTDIGRDGALSGTNLDVYARLSGIAGLQVIASGGVSFETEIAALRDMGLYGCILGKALYAGKLRLERALAIARGEAEPC